MYICMYDCLQFCVCMFMSYVCVRVYICVYEKYVYLYGTVCSCICIYVYVYTYIYIYVCVCCISLCRCKLYLYQISSTSLKTIYMPYPQWLEWVLIWRQTLSFIYTHVLTRHWYVWYVTACKAAHVTVHASETQARTHTHKHLQYITAAHRACIMTWVCL